MESLSCLLSQILTCLQTQKSNEQEVLDALAAIEAKLCVIDEGINGNCPMALAEPLTTTTAVVDGDQVAANPPGSEFEVTNAAGDVIGTAEVVSATYDAATDKTTFTLTNNTVTAATLTTATAITKQRVAATVKTEEKTATTEKTETVATRG